jgi:hypothetical protein
MSHARRAALLVIALLAVAGCARPMLTRPVLARPGSGPSSLPGRVLLIARQPAPENRGVADRAAELMAAGLRPAGEVWEAHELVREATAAAAAPWAVALLQRLALGGFPTMDDRVELLRFAITGVIVTEVTTYEQVWGKYAKFTRVGIEARAFDVAAGSIVWRLQRGVEVEDLRGRAFEHATEKAVQALLADIYPGTAFSMVDLWRVWRR